MLSHIYQISQWIELTKLRIFILCILMISVFKNTLFILIMCDVCAWVHMSWCTGQMKTLGHCFSPFIVTWGLRLNSSFQACKANAYIHLSICSSISLLAYFTFPIYVCNTSGVHFCGMWNGSKYFFFMRLSDDPVTFCWKYHIPPFFLIITFS